MEKAECDLECPHCHKVWGRMTFRYGSKVNPRDIKILQGNRKRLKKDDPLKCSCCGHEYTNYDVILSIATSRAKSA